MQPDDNEILAYYIPDEEVDARLNQPPGHPLWASVSFPDDFNQDVQQSLEQMGLQIQAMRKACWEKGIELRLETLTQRFGLTPFERDVILLCLAPELDSGYLRLYAYLQDDINQLYPTIGLMLNLLCPNIENKVASQNQLTPFAPLLKNCILSRTPPAGMLAAPDLAYILRLDDRIRRYLLEDDAPDEQIQPYLRQSKVGLSWPELLLPDTLLGRLQQVAVASESLIFYFSGPYGVGRQNTAAALARFLEKPLLTVDCQRLHHVSLEQFLPLIARILREATLQQAILYWYDFDVFLKDDKSTQLHLLLETLDEQNVLSILAGETRWQPARSSLTRPFYQVSFPLPSASQRQKIWQQMLNGYGSDLELQSVATQFRLTGGQIQAAMTTALQLAHWRDPENRVVQTADLLKASRLHSNQTLNRLAQQIRPHYRWTDIILPNNQLGQLRRLIDQVKYQGVVFEEWGFANKLTLGRGVHALFTGQPGTGKTMAAEILAGELELDLYKIDLSSVVSKYIGETEKNLARIFAEADTSNAVLFFDEADALFGKRTEVKDSHDRYANLEISYLLQKMDEYQGVVILATNLRENLDSAFVRRIRFIIEFPLPDAAQRLQIWQGIWPSQAPLSPEVNLSFLADQLDVPGGVIRNIALAAAFLAAAGKHDNSGPPPVISMKHLIAATEEEYRKLGRFLPQIFRTRV